MNTTLHSTDAQYFTATQQVGVLLPLPFDRFFDYRVARGQTVCIGQFVSVPFGNRVVAGVVWQAGNAKIDPGKIKEIIHVFETRPLTDESRKFIEWVAQYTIAKKGLVLKMAMSIPKALEQASSYTAYVMGNERAAKQAGFRFTSARKKVIDTAQNTTEPLTATELAQKAGVSDSVVRGLAEAEILKSLTISRKLDFPIPDPATQGPTLNKSQQAAADALASRVGDGYSVTLLDGVTGSGKTEVYFEALAEALRQNKQVLVLVPEIALTSQWLERFKKRFGVKPAQWHSDLSERLRRETWRGVASGNIRVLVGARSALFLPFCELGLIIVDEEHEQAYKQEEGVIYHGRDMAVVRAHISGIAAVLASATPSLETVQNVNSGRYEIAELHDRYAEAAIPDFEVIDIRKNKPERGDWGMSWVAPPLVSALETNLEKGEQALLFLNRRGYAPLTLCRACGHRLQCPHCTAWLVEHRHNSTLKCHHCDFTIRVPEKCPECETEGMLAPCGPGVERLAEEVRARFPKAAVELVASDTLESPQAFADLIARVAEREIDILIGTQILAKGHHFPRLTLVGVIDADLGLSGGDLRASERTFQLLMQVAGRAGRALWPGRVLLQTTQPENEVIRALATANRNRFINAEMKERELLAMPPFGRLAALVVSGTNEGTVCDVAASLARKAPRGNGISVLGPAPAPISWLRGKHRQRLLLKVPKNTLCQPVIRKWLNCVKVPSSVKVQVDIDPYSFL